MIGFPLWRGPKGEDKLKDDEKLVDLLITSFLINQLITFLKVIQINFKS